MFLVPVFLIGFAFVSSSASARGEADRMQGSGQGQNGNDRKSEEQSGKNSLVARFLKQKNGGDNKVDSAAQEQEKATIDTNLKNYKTNGIADAHFKGSSNSFPSQPQPLSSHPANTNWLKSSSFERSNYGSQQDAQFKRSSNSFPSQPQPLSSHPANTNWLKSPSFGKSNYGSQQGMSSIGYQPSASSNTYSAISPSYFGGSSNSIRSDQQNKEEFTEGCNVGGRKLRVGDKWTVTGICGKFTCQGNNFRTLTTECPTLRFQEGSNCYVDDQDMSLEFPQCCPILICPNAASQTMQIATPPNAIATPPNASNKNDYKFF